MKISKPIKITLIVLGVFLIVSAIVVPTTLYFAVWKNETKNTDPELSKHHLTYSVTVKDMTTLNADEAEKIKSEIKAKVRTELSFLEEDTDYKIDGLDKIRTTADLSIIRDEIIIAATEDTEKASGSFKLAWRITEDISNRIFEVTVSQADADDGLTSATATRLNRMLKSQIKGALSSGQPNEEGTDYDIVGFAAIKEKAKIADLAKTVYIVGRSSHLKGIEHLEFKVGP